MPSLAHRRSNPFRNAARLRKIVAVFVRNGFQDVAVKVRVGRFFLDRLIAHDVRDLSAPERLRLSFEQLGPTFVKLGQLLAMRPDLIPQEFCEEFKKLHDQVSTLPFNEIERVLVNHFGAELNQVFREFNTTPLAAASIAQVYRGVLQNGDEVVVKVQRPGIEKIIHEDISVLTTLVELSERYIANARVFNLSGILEEFRRTMELEINFVVEANNIRRFQENFASDPDIKIPRVYSEYTGRRVLVMEALPGIPLSHKNALEQEGIDRETVLRRGLRAYLKMVYTDGLFHGDLHAGNLFVLPNNQIGLIDFGVVGRLNRKTQTAIANMLMALADEDYDRFADQYLDLAPYSEKLNADAFARDLRDLIAPHFGLTLKHFNLGRLFLDSTAISARYGLTLPSELILFFKSMVTIEGMGRLLIKDFDFLSVSLEFAGELVQAQANPGKMVRDAAFIARDLNSLLSVLPRQIKQTLRRINSPEFAIRIEDQRSAQLRSAIERGAWLIFWGLIFSAAILGFIIKLV